MRRKVLIAAAALAVLAIGIGGGAVWAQESDSEDGSTIKGFVSRVAEILGLEEQTVQDAFTQAKQEMMDESIESKLAAMVESGKLTQEQADEIQEWYDDKPDSIGSWYAHPKMLTAMVESGKLTQEQADEIQEWYDAKPDSIGSWNGLRQEGIRPQALARPQRPWQTLLEGRFSPLQGDYAGRWRRLGLEYGERHVS